MLFETDLLSLFLLALISTIYFLLALSPDPVTTKFLEKDRTLGSIASTILDVFIRDYWTSKVYYSTAGILSD